MGLSGDVEVGMGGGGGGGVMEGGGVGPGAAAEAGEMWDEGKEQQEDPGEDEESIRRICVEKEATLAEVRQGEGGGGGRCVGRGEGEGSRSGSMRGSGKPSMGDGRKQGLGLTERVFSLWSGIVLVF